MESGESVLRAGYRLDRYELLCPIASGGMATVWLAQLRGKRGFEKLFAIKTIKTELTDDATFQEMFLDEARIASGIQHPNVAQILDLGEQEDILYIVMEWVDGDSLARIRKLAQNNKTPLPLGVALRIICDACAGLHAAHELKDEQGNKLGVVHRDVSPQNILVSSAGSVKVIDFGVAKARNRRASQTREGTVKGKVRYMAPEQVHGLATDRRADVWAIGVCLYELVTGDVPFGGDSDVDVIRRLLSDEPPPRPEGAVPEAIEELLAHSLVRDPEERFASAGAMHRALQNAIDEVGLASANEDVADFLHENLPELETKRRATITKALDAAKTRDKQPALSAPSSPRARAPAEDEAFAPTVLSQRKPPAKAPASAKALLLVPHAEESKMTPIGAAFTGEVPGLPKRRTGVLWLLFFAALGAAAWFVWPGGARLRAAFTSSTPPPAATASAPPSVPSSAESAEALVTPIATASTLASSGVAPSPPMHGGGGAHRRPHGGPIGPSAGGSTGPSPNAIDAGAAWPFPAPSASEAPADDNNPYN